MFEFFIALCSLPTAKTLVVGAADSSKLAPIVDGGSETTVDEQ